MLRRMPIIGILLTLGSLLPIQGLLSDPLFAATQGEIYRRVDRNGVISFTNVPTNDTFTKVDLGTLRLRARLPMRDLEGTIAHHSRQQQLDPALISAIIKAESDFDPDAVSRAGAIGLMQLMPQTAVRLEVRDPFNPEENIAGGARYLRYLLDRFHGNLPLALAAYNAGATRVEQYNALPPIHETRRYVKKVLRFYRQYDERRISLPSSIRPFSAPTWSRTVTFSSFQNP